jgi:hypothetical protein
MKIHPVFHVNLLRPAFTDLLPEQHQDFSPFVEINGGEKWEIKEVIDSRWNQKGRSGKPNLKYTVKLIGYDELTESPATWLNNA